MKVKDLTHIWVRQEEARVERTREIAKMLDAEIGDREVAITPLAAKSAQYYATMSPHKIVEKLATYETLAIYELLRNL